VSVTVYKTVSHFIVPNREFAMLADELERRGRKLDGVYLHIGE
jgi:hypothetical protein